MTGGYEIDDWWIQQFDVLCCAYAEMGGPVIVKTAVRSPFSDVGPTASTEHLILKIFLNQNLTGRHPGKTEKNKYERDVFHAPYCDYLSIQNLSNAIDCISLLGYPGAPGLKLASDMVTSLPQKFKWQSCRLFVFVPNHGYRDFQELNQTIIIVAPGERDEVLWGIGRD